MNCSQCGQEVAVGASFCSRCGAALGRDDAAPDDWPAGAGRFQAGGALGSARDAPEQELWSGAYSPKAMTGPFIAAAVLTVLGMIGASFAGPIGWIAAVVGAVVVFSYLGLLLLYRRISVRYRLTTQRFLRERGILSRTVEHILIVTIDDVTMRQGLVERMLNLGTIVLNTTDVTTPVLVMAGIENPRHVADLIDETRRSERNRRGLYTVNA